MQVWVDGDGLESALGQRTVNRAWPGVGPGAGGGVASRRGNYYFAPRSDATSL